MQLASIRLSISLLLLGSFSSYAQLHFIIESTTTSQDSLAKNLTPGFQFSNYEDLEKYSFQLSDSLQKKGFLNASFSKILKQNDTLYIGQLIIGEKTRFIHLKYNTPILASYARRLDILGGDDNLVIKLDELEKTLADFAELEAFKGYPLSSFQITEIHSVAQNLYGTLLLKRQKKRHIDKITVSGYEKFPNSFIKNYAFLKKGETFNEKKINRKIDELKNLSFVESSRDPEILFEEDSTALYLYFKKHQANTFDGLLGFGNNQDQDKLRLDGYLNLYLLNNLNYGELLELNYKSDGNDQQNLHIALELPFLFSSPIGAEAALNIFRRDSTFSTSEQALNLNYQFNARSRLKVGIQLENSSALNDTLTFQRYENIEDYDKTLFSAGYDRTTRNPNVLFPFKSIFNIQFFTGKRTSSDNSEVQFAIKSRAYYDFKLNPKQYFSIENQTRFLASETYLTNELFRFGGINSIRGFQENAIYANLYTVFKTEYRYAPTSNFFIHTISDAAYFENEYLKEEGFLYSLGFGAGINTAAGLLNINLSNGLRENEDFKFSNSILHIQLTTTF